MTDPLAARVAFRLVQRTLAARVASRFIQRMADQPPGQRKHVQELVKPINQPRVKQPDITRDEGVKVTEPDKRDILPQDIFDPTNGDVLNLALTGEDLTEVNDEIPDDKGYGTVKNLSQYLIRTEGGGEGGPEGKNL
jgi:hypothetical protein